MSIHLPAEPPDHAPGPSGDVLARGARVVYKLILSAFIGLHVASILWWNIPESGFPTDQRRASLPTSLVRIEQRIFDWKHRIRPTSAVAVVLESYTHATATWQNWYLFGPNPFSTYSYLEAYAVVGLDKDGKPIYDPTPIYTSYRGTFEDEVARSSGAGNLFSPYEHDFKLAMNLTGEESSPELTLFARHWAEVYAQRAGRRPLGADIIYRAYDVPPAFSGIRPLDMKYREGVLWWFRY